MKIVKIEYTEKFDYKVSFEPNVLEKLFWVKPKIKYYRRTLGTYIFNGQSEYINQKGE